MPASELGFGVDSFALPSPISNAKMMKKTPIIQKVKDFLHQLVKFKIPFSQFITAGKNSGTVLY
jgi:hypothetical protein